MSWRQQFLPDQFFFVRLQLQEAYKDKEEENKRLKHYIDTILLNIVENYPQLLEVKSKWHVFHLFSVVTTHSIFFFCT